MGNFQCALPGGSDVQLAWGFTAPWRTDGSQEGLACRLRSSFPSSVASFPAVIPALPLGHEAVAFFGGGAGAVPRQAYDLSSPMRDQTLGPQQ